MWHDKPPVGTLSALLEHNRPSIIMSDGTIRPGKNSITNEPLDIISSFQLAGSSDKELKCSNSKRGLVQVTQLWWNVHLQYYANIYRCCWNATFTHGLQSSDDKRR